MITSQEIRKNSSKQSQLSQAFQIGVTIWGWWLWRRLVCYTFTCACICVHRCRIINTTHPMNAGILEMLEYGFRNIDATNDKPRTFAISFHFMYALWFLSLTHVYYTLKKCAWKLRKLMKTLRLFSSNYAHQNCIIFTFISSVLTSPKLL